MQQIKVIKRRDLYKMTRLVNNICPVVVYKNNHDLNSITEIVSDKTNVRKQEAREQFAKLFRTAQA